MRCLSTPDQWRDPTYDTLRDAYQLYRRRQRKPDAYQRTHTGAYESAEPDTPDRSGNGSRSETGCCSHADVCKTCSDVAATMYLLNFRYS